MTSITRNNPWDQLPDETDTAYHRFSIYLELGPDRSLEKTRQKVGKTSGYLRQLEHWSSKYNWVRRSSEYDSHNIRKALQNKEKILDEVTARLLEAAIQATEELIKLAFHEGTEQTGEGITSVYAQKIKAIESILDRVGVVRQKDTIDLSKPASVNNFIQNVYQKIENYNQNGEENSENQ